MSNMASRCVAAGVAAAWCLAAAAGADDSALEKGLLDALRFDRTTDARVGDSGKAIQAYMREGVVDRKPNRRSEYTDYYLVRKPARLLGHDLVVMEEEYMTRFIGCCVNAGMGVSVRIRGSADALEEFAEKNGCRFSDDVNLQEELDRLGIDYKVPPGRYATLSCRERDAFDLQR